MHAVHGDTGNRTAGNKVPADIVETVPNTVSKEDLSTTS